MNEQPDPLELEPLLARAERDPAASRELDFLCDLTAAAERAELAAKPAPRWLVRPWLLPAAASLLFLAAGALWFARRESGPDVRSAWRAAPVFEASTLRAGEPLTAAFAQAMEPYTRADWAAAQQKLDAFLADHPEHAPARFYLGVVQAELGARAAAQATFELVVARGTGLLADHARLRLALLALDEGRSEEGRAALEALAGRESPFAAPARALLQDLGP